MANIASNTYIFYGDREELGKCYDTLTELYEKVGSNICCVDRTVENIVVNCEWIECIEELSDDADSFWMDTNSKWYGNPLYWFNWVKTNYPKLAVAFMCEEAGMGIFEKVDPDNKFDEYIYISGYSIPEEDIAKLPKVIKDAMSGDCVYGTFIKDEVFNSEYQPSDLPDSVTYEEYTNTTYDTIRSSDEAYLAMLSNMKERLQQSLPENTLSKEYVNDVHDAIKTKTDEYLDKWQENHNTRKNLLS